jgi:hypothetical protein
VVALAVKFLLDANLSPRVARFLVEQFQLDVTSLQGQGLGELPDHEVIELARRQGRVIVIQDQDKRRRLHRLAADEGALGVNYLDRQCLVRLDQQHDIRRRRVDGISRQI